MISPEPPCLGVRCWVRAGQVDFAAEGKLVTAGQDGRVKIWQVTLSSQAGQWAVGVWGGEIGKQGGKVSMDLEVLGGRCKMELPGLKSICEAVP